MALLDQDTYLTERVEGQLQWLGRASKTNKQGFLRLRMVEIVLGTAITVFSPYAVKFEWGALAIALAGGGIAMASSVLALNRNQENWVRYRSLSEALKHEKYLYVTGTPPYDDPSKAFSGFVSTVEALMLEEQSGWAKLAAQDQGSAPAAAPPKPANHEPEVSGRV
ncbi:MAG: hypothetical protein RLZZ459_2412 [Cyanobacteriota bacterium]|jgi:hypothetical protein